jgi:hypothetical protein
MVKAFEMKNERPKYSQNTKYKLSLVPSHSPFPTTSIAPRATFVSLFNQFFVGYHSAPFI